DHSNPALPAKLWKDFLGPGPDMYPDIWKVLVKKSALDNQSAVISCPELDSVTSPQSIYGNFASNPDKALSQTEFTNDWPYPSSAATYFKKADTNGDNYVSAKEFNLISAPEQGYGVNNLINLLGGGDSRKIVALDLNAPVALVVGSGITDSDRVTNWNASKAF